MVHFQIFVIFTTLFFGLSHLDDNQTITEQERTFIMIKPDGLQRGLVHEVIKRFEKKGLKLVGMKLIKVGHTETVIHVVTRDRRKHELELNVGIIDKFDVLQAERQTVADHYEHLKNEPFYFGLIDYITSGPVIPMVWEGYNAVKFGRDIIGKTNPSESPIGTIRGDFCLSQGLTVVHGAHSVKEAQREIKLWFKPHELISWEPAVQEWIF